MHKKLFQDFAKWVRTKRMNIRQFRMTGLLFAEELIANVHVTEDLTKESLPIGEIQIKTAVKEYCYFINLPISTNLKLTKKTTEI